MEGGREKGEGGRGRGGVGGRRGGRVRRSFKQKIVTTPRGKRKMRGKRKVTKWRILQ